MSIALHGLEWFQRELSKTRIILGKNMAADNQKQIREWDLERQPNLRVAQAYFDDLRHEIRLRE